MPAVTKPANIEWIKILPAQVLLKRGREEGGIGEEGQKG